AYDGAAHRIRDIVYFQIEKNASAHLLNRPHDLGAGGGIKLESNFEKAGMRCETADKTEGLLTCRHVERDDDFSPQIHRGCLRVHALPLRIAGSYAVFRTCEDQFIAQDSRPT